MIYIEDLIQLSLTTKSAVFKQWLEKCSIEKEMQAVRKMFDILLVGLRGTPTRRMWGPGCWRKCRGGCVGRFIIRNVDAVIVVKIYSSACNQWVSIKQLKYHNVQFVRRAGFQATNRAWLRPNLVSMIWHGSAAQLVSFAMANWLQVDTMPACLKCATSTQ